MKECIAFSAELIKNSHVSIQQMETLSSQPRSQSLPVLDALNAVSATPWKINKPVSYRTLRVLSFLFHICCKSNVDNWKFLKEKSKEIGGAKW